MSDDHHLRALERLAHLGKLGAGVGHEARNVLTGVLGFTQLAAQRVDDPVETRALLRLIERETARALEILAAFLALGRSTSRAGAVEVNALAADAARLVGHAFRLGHVGVAVELDVDVGTVEGDAGALRQVIVNLAFNAAQAMPEGGEVRVSTRVEHDEIVLRVADHGPGVPAHLREHIFAPFFTTRPDGTGLGLSVSAAIVAEHGGHLALEASERGAVFAVRLPRSARSRP